MRNDTDWEQLLQETQVRLPDRARTAYADAARTTVWQGLIREDLLFTAVEWLQADQVQL